MSRCEVFRSLTPEKRKRLNAVMKVLAEAAPGQYSPEDVERMVREAIG